ncbi:hypothetical protein C8Q70DRAFT_396105 [Cubamyces menziesii]|nr:hypothetical protein C8Q70DRAFT_396105 [Cubamyces menziesii]
MEFRVRSCSCRKGVRPYKAVFLSHTRTHTFRRYLEVKLIPDLIKLRWDVSIAYGCSAGSDIILASTLAIIIPGNFIYTAISIVGARLYANSVLALLNSRRYLNDRLQDDFTSVDVRTRGEDVARMSPSSTS